MPLHIIKMTMIVIFLPSAPPCTLTATTSSSTVVSSRIPSRVLSRSATNTRQVERAFFSSEAIPDGKRTRSRISPVSPFSFSSTTSYSRSNPAPFSLRRYSYVFRDFFSSLFTQIRSSSSLIFPRTACTLAVSTLKTIANGNVFLREGSCTRADTRRVQRR